MSDRRSRKPAAPRKQTTPKRSLTFSYIVFYILFWPDTYRIAMGLMIAALFVPLILPHDMGASGKTILFLMVATIGYAATAMPGRSIAGFLRKRILGNHHPPSR